MKLSIIVPVYNEQDTVSKILDQIKQVDLTQLQLDKEIVVVNDGSTDNSENILRNTYGIKLINHKKNKGKGHAIRTGFKHTSGDIIIVQDADLEYDPNDYHSLLKPILNNKTKVVYGSRYLHSKQNQKKFMQKLKNVYSNQYLLGYIGGRLITVTANLLYNLNITDEATCYKVFHKDVLKNIDLKCTGFEFCPEFTAKVAKAGHSIHEVPINYYPRRYDEGKKVNWKDGVQAIWILFKYRFSD